MVAPAMHLEMKSAEQGVQQQQCGLQLEDSGKDKVGKS